MGPIEILLAISGEENAKWIVKCCEAKCSELKVSEDLGAEQNRQSSNRD